jgi:hypothetical protein
LAALAVTVRPSKPIAGWVLVGAVCLGLVVPTAMSFGVGFAAGRLPMRAQVMPAGALGVGLALSLVACGWLLGGKRDDFAKPWLPFAAVATVAVALAATAPDAIGLIRGEALRGQMVVQRDMTIARAVAAGQAKISVLPAPMLFAPSEATDISFLPGVKNYMEAGYRAYLRVPRASEFILQGQPAGYCLATPPPPFARALTCQELSRAG